uniref:t-SNARE coiled-coil homology domain-containing protein n=1 Tax=Malurus cyaneus samueli TaxID=2593467 RepID=A0A8C5TK25_9PASS
PALPRDEPFPPPAVSGPGLTQDLPSSINICSGRSSRCCAAPRRRASPARSAASARPGRLARQAAALQPQLGALPAAPAGGSGRAGPRVRQTQLWLLLRRYGAVLARHYARESRYRQRLKEQIQRQAELAGITLGAQDVDLLAESPQGPRIVGRDLEELKAKHHLGLAQARQRQLLELEAQMLELRGLFVQLEGLLAQQHGAADSVEQHVLRSLDCAAQTGGEVKRAGKYQRPSRLSALLTAALGLCSCCWCLVLLAHLVRWCKDHAHLP